VIVIFASRFDESARSLAARWKNYDASLLTCDDLSVTGWRQFLNDNGTNRAVVSGQVLDVSNIDGVLIRWPGVFAQELIQIAPPDRDYVASEMMAFLFWWFSTLNCPVINKPTPVNLTGPAWRLEQWTYLGAQLGIPVKTARRHVAPGTVDNEPATPVASLVTVVANRCFGDVDPLLLEQSRQLARAADVSLAQIGFNGPNVDSVLTQVNLTPELTDEVADALLDLLRQREGGVA
jgi:hypothetical protein